MKLVSGAGTEKTGACWMSALHWYTRNGKTWSDQPECVSPVVRTLCIRLNDFIKTDKEREEIIGPHLFEPVGTRTTKEDEIRRDWICADRAVRVFLPFWLARTKSADLVKHAEILTALHEIKDISSEKASRPFVQAANNAASVAAAADAYPFIKAELLRVILDCCAVGRKTVCPTKTKDEVVEFLCSFDGKKG